MKEAQATRKIGRRTLVFVDEIHRFNKAQQDAFLPYVEAGDIVLLGATTENPSFEVIPALLSRMAVHVLKPLGPEEVATLLRRALDDGERGLKNRGLTVEDGVIGDLAAFADGDGRRALNALEALARHAEAEGHHRLQRADLKRVLEKQLLYDKSGEQHYDVISAFIKSIRGSDPDAALFWLARMLEAGEDPRYIARRMVVHASEDIGLADPRALLIATAAAHAVEYVGLPEARLNLAEAAIYLARAPKSNSVYLALGKAMEDATSSDPVPLNLRDPSTPTARQLGHGKGYKYPHDFPGHVVEQEYRPARFSGTRYFEPSGEGEDV
jgi:putative ATPase